MKPVDFISWFDEDEARLAVLSSFEFEPIHFESRLMRSAALIGARRIIVFVDANQFQKMLADRPPARWINQRYLVVPVKRKGGVFHPKLGLLVGEERARVFCGSNNLTQAGSAHNLELLNSVVITAGEEPRLDHLAVAQAALAFFKSCAEFGEPQAARVAKRWLEEMTDDFPWLAAEAPATEVELVHTLDGSLWDWLRKRVGTSPPRKIQVLSPFYDADLRLLERVRKAWPTCSVEITAQQRTSNLPASLLSQFGKSVRLFDLDGAGSRRLHAKLLTVVADGRTICLCGSANFTAAAFDGLNVETCFAWDVGNERLKELYEGEFTRSAISPGDFEPGVEQPPAEDTESVTPLSVKSAMLDDSGKLVVTFKIKDGMPVENLGVALQRAGEASPVVCLEVKPGGSGLAEFSLKPETVSSFGGAVAVYLIAEAAGQTLSSPPTWLIQEGRLTHETSENGNHQGRETEIRETGRGLVEQLDEIGTKEGQLQLIQYLNNLSIRFDDSEHSRRGGWRPKPKIQDPYRPDTAPEWMAELASQFPDIEAAILEFADRHSHKVLRRHARRANINGLANFVDVLITVTKLLYVFWRRGVVNKQQMIGRLVQYLEIFTDGFETQEDGSEGYISGLFEALHGSSSLLKKPLEENNVAGHLRALLLIAQSARANPNEPGASRPRQCLQSKLEKVRESLAMVKLAAATPDQVASALRAYDMLTEDEIATWLKELAG